MGRSVFSTPQQLRRDTAENPRRPSRFLRVGDGVGNRVLVPELEQGGQLVDVEFLNPDLDVLRQYEVEEGLLLGVESLVDGSLGVGRSFLSAERRQRIGDVGQDVE